MNSLIKFLFFLCLFSFSLAQTYKVVPTEYGSIRGVSNENGTFFFGVPFAKSPIGSLRWKMPQPPAHWDGVLDTLAPVSLFLIYFCFYILSLFISLLFVFNQQPMSHLGLQ